jgi:hypothetical protein
MAVTIENSPEDWQTSDNPIIYQFSSDMDGEPNFSFKIELKLDAVVVFTDKVFVEVSGNAHFDASSVTKWKVPGPQKLGALEADSGTTKTIQLVVTENYGDPPVDEASASSLVTNVFKAGVSDREFLQNEYGDYELTRWFTDHPTNDMDIFRLDDKIISILGAGAAVTAELNFYDANDVLQHTYVTPVRTYDIWQFNLTDGNLILTAGVPDLSIITYFTVQVDSSEIMTLRYYDEQCEPPVSVTWINKYGAFDSFVFKHVNIESGDVKADNYAKQFGGWDADAYTFDLANSGTLDYFKRTNNKGRAVTDDLTQEIQNWLTEVFKGLRHQMVLPDGTTYPIRVTTSRFQLQQARFTDQRNIVIDYDASSFDNSLTL